MVTKVWSLEKERRWKRAKLVISVHSHAHQASLSTHKHADKCTAHADSTSCQFIPIQVKSEAIRVTRVQYSSMALLLPAKSSQARRTVWENKEQKTQYGLFHYHISSSASTVAAAWTVSFWMLIILMKQLCATGSDETQQKLTPFLVPSTCFPIKENKLRTEAAGHQWNLSQRTG